MNRRTLSCAAFGAALLVLTAAKGCNLIAGLDDP